jgi:D-amino peptidase
MKVFLSVDMEGITGVTDWRHVMHKDPEYGEARERMIADVNAVIDAAIEAGATDVLVNDAHDRMGNLILSKLNAKARLISGFTKPYGMMQGVEGRDAALLIGYHARMGATPAVLDHTLYGGSVSRVHLNGQEVGEAELNASLAGEFGVPVIFLSGDNTVCELAEKFIGPWLRTAAVKRAIGRGAAESLHPDVTAGLLRTGVIEALQGLDEAHPTQVDLPCDVQIEFLATEMTDSAMISPWAERVDGRTVRFRSETMVDAYRTIEVLGMLASFPVLLRHV